MDAFFIIFLSAIKGAGDMQFVLLATILMAPLPVVSAWIGLRYFGWGLMGCWTVLTIWITLNGLIYAARYLQGNWRTMRVIEPELL
jgi:MATE family multidrug resistance protein